MNRFKEENYEYIRKRNKSYFSPTTCREATYDCRVKKQYMRIMFETNKLKQLFNKVHEKFLKAINHMEFHPTLGKEKKGTCVIYLLCIQNKQTFNLSSLKHQDIIQFH